MVRSGENLKINVGRTKSREVWPMFITIPKDLSYSGSQRKAIKLIDVEILDIVKALENAGIVMRGSCSGHGERNREILLNDGRTLIIKNKGGVL